MIAAVAFTGTRGPASYWELPPRWSEPLSTGLSSSYKEGWYILIEDVPRRLLRKLFTNFQISETDSWRFRFCELFVFGCELLHPGQEEALEHRCLLAVRLMKGIRVGCRKWLPTKGESLLGSACHFTGQILNPGSLSLVTNTRGRSQELLNTMPHSLAEDSMWALIIP